MKTRIQDIGDVLNRDEMRKIMAGEEMDPPIGGGGGNVYCNLGGTWHGPLQGSLESNTYICGAQDNCGGCAQFQH